MSLFAALTREHRLFGELIDRLERSVSRDEESARAEIRNTLLVLLPALDRHEELEDLVFADPQRPRSKGAERAAARIALQHRKIGTLRAEIAAMLKAGSSPSAAGLNAAVLSLVQRLRLHFQSEERGLWPHYDKTSRSLSRSLANVASKRVKELEGQIAEHRRMISDYLDRRV